MSTSSSSSAFDVEHCNLLQLATDDIANGLSSFSPLQQCLLLCSFLILVTFVVSTWTGNYSQVDKLWSIIPFLYTWLTICDARTFLMAVLATIWGIRLTWNFNRRGGYKWPPWDGDEDYRWKYIQDGFFLPILKNKIVWTIFNFGFISLYQNILLFLFVSPAAAAHIVSVHCNESPLNLYDAVATVLFLTFVVIESIADNQQYHFQTEKYRRKNNSNEPLLTGEFADGFKQSGLFSVVRKPNYAAEQATWISFYIFSIASLQGQRFLNWSIVGCLLLVMLFLLSGWFTEKITLSKYPKYKDYLERVPLYIPMAFGTKQRDDESKTKSS